jgi:O-antigen/teichoic acid export membrane protein
VIALFVGVFPQTVMSIFTQNADYTLYFYLILILLLSVPPILVDAIFFLRKDIKALLSYTHWSQLVSLVLTLMVAVFMPTIEYFIYALLLSYSLRFGYLVFDVLGSAAFDLSFDLMRRYAIFAMPLIGTVFLGSMMDMIDGWFVTYYFDESYFPVFRYGAREMPLSAVLMSSLSMAIIPSLSADSQGIIMLKRKVTSLMHWLFPVSGLLMIISPILFPLVYEAAYLDSAFIFNIYLLILISRVLLPQSICLAHHKTGIIILSGMIEVVANILLSFWWMQIWGIFGLAMATVVAYFVQKIILVMYNRQKFGISLTDYIDLKYYVFYSLSLIGIFFITLYIWK